MIVTATKVVVIVMVMVVTKSVVARSSAKVEFRVMAQGVCELLWMKIILDDLKIKLKLLWD